MEEELHGYKARIFQHELDHLNGIMFVDHIANTRDLMMQSEYDRIYAEELEEDTHLWGNELIPGLTTYKEVHGDLLVPSAFVVPASEPWPESLWGLELGTRVCELRSEGANVGLDPERINWLESKGFVWNDFEQ